MKIQFELTLIVRHESKIVDKNGIHTWDTKSIDTVMGTSMTSLMGQFLIVLATVHQWIVDSIKAEHHDYDIDDIPF